MSVNFFETPCREPARNNLVFGICDDQHGSKAYTADDFFREKWIAIVKNGQQLEITFTPIDNCIPIYKEGTGDEESTCDGMLTFSSSLFLVELKNWGTGGWLPKAIKQLRNTIELINANHDLSVFKYKKAYACNKKHPNFSVFDNEMRKEFFMKTKFRIDIQAEIVIK